LAEAAKENAPVAEPAAPSTRTRPQSACDAYVRVRPGDSAPVRNALFEVLQGGARQSITTPGVPFSPASVAATLPPLRNARRQMRQQNLHGILGRRVVAPAARVTPPPATVKEEGRAEEGTAGEEEDEGEEGPVRGRARGLSDKERQEGVGGIGGGMGQAVGRSAPPGAGPARPAGTGLFGLQSVTVTRKLTGTKRAMKSKWQLDQERIKRAVDKKHKRNQRSRERAALTRKEKLAERDVQRQAEIVAGINAAQPDESRGKRGARGPYNRWIQDGWLPYMHNTLVRHDSLYHGWKALKVWF
jgi:hypothetical protein